MPQGALQLSNEDYWSTPWKNRRAVEDPLYAVADETLLVDAPRRIAIDVRDSAPLLALRLGKTAIQVATPFREFGIAVASDVETGQTWAGLAVQPPERSVEQPEPREISPTATSSVAFSIDLRARLAIPWRPSNLSASVILRDKLSEPMSMELALSPGAFVDAEAEKFRLAEKLKAPLPPVRPAPGRGLPAYGAVDGAPPVPESEGLVFSAPRVMRASAQGPVRISGAFRLKPPPALRVTAGERAKDLQAQLGDQPLPAALVHITLVITASKYPAPLILPMVVPSWRLDQGLATGQLSIDLDAIANLRLPGRTFFLYAFSGAHRFGPAPLAMIEDE
jgi:hypothetical protein